MAFSSEHLKGGRTVGAPWSDSVMLSILFSIVLPCRATEEHGRVRAGKIPVSGWAATKSDLNPFRPDSPDTPSHLGLGQ